MTKEQVIKGAIKLIEMKRDKYGLKVEDRGTGRGYEGTFWESVMEDNSNIPQIIANGKDDAGRWYYIELRPFWETPEIDVRREIEGGEELLIFNYSDSVKDEEAVKYIHTGDFRVCEVRVDTKGNYRDCIEEVYEMIDFVEAHGIEQEGAAENG